MSSSNKGWIVAASIGTVEALKDQGICRWNYGFRSFQQHANKSNIKSHSQAKRSNFSSQSSATSSSAGGSKNMVGDGERSVKQSEESLRTVMYLSCWGPNN